MYPGYGLEKISDSILMAEVYNTSENLEANKIAIDEGIFGEVTGLELPAKVRLMEEENSKDGTPKPFFYKKDFLGHQVVDKKESLDARLQRDLYEGYAVISKYSRYVNEILEGGYVKINTTPSLLDGKGSHNSRSIY